jgi:hypothetical protein
MFCGGTMTTKQELIAALNTDRAKLLDLIARLDEAHAQHIVYGDWRVQDILAHIASGEKDTLTYAKMVAAGRPMGASMSDGEPFDLDRWNQAQVNKRRSKSLQEVAEELNANRKATLDYTSGLDAEALARRGAHPIFQAATVADVLSSVAEDDRHHLREIEDAL